MTETILMSLDNAYPPLLSRKTRNGTRSRAEIARMIRDDIHPVRRTVLHGIALLWNDHWDAAHDIAQSDEGEPSHDFLHYLLHRREGDFGNAGYWMRRAESHPCAIRIANRVDSILPKEHPMRTIFLPDGKWNAPAFLKAVRGAKEDDALLCRIQAEEMRAFAEWLEETL